jgi:hypothetical protein
MGKRRTPPSIKLKAAELRPYADRLARLISEHTYQFKVTSKKHDIKILDRQAVQARIADVAMWLHAWACTLGKLDLDLSKHGGNGSADLEFQRDKAAAIHFFDLAERAVEQCFRELYVNADDTMLLAAEAAIKHSNSQPNSDYVIPERSPNAKGTGRALKQDGIKQFGSGSVVSKPVGAGVN